MKKTYIIFLSFLSLNVFAQELTIVDEYNQKQQALAKRKELLSSANKQRIQRENSILQAALVMQAEADKARAIAGIENIRLDNKPGGLDMTREKMNMMGGGRLPPTPPTGKIINSPNLKN